MDKMNLKQALNKLREDIQYWVTLNIQNVLKKIDTTNARIDTANSRIDSANNRIETTNTRIDTTNTKIETANTRIDTINTRIGTLDSSKVNAADLATVAMSGDYNDLQNKPNLATVATSGLYNDLIGKPTIKEWKIEDNGQGRITLSYDIVVVGTAIAEEEEF